MVNTCMSPAVTLPDLELNARYLTANWHFFKDTRHISKNTKLSSHSYLTYELTWEVTAIHLTYFVD